MTRNGWIVVLLISCSAPQKPDQRPAAGSLVRGDRRESASSRTSAARPPPWERTHGPFQSDRMDVAAYRQHRRREHLEAHGRRALSAERFAHPACSGVGGSERSRCPLLALSWTSIREIPGGLNLVGSVPAASRGMFAAQLHRRVLCHVAFGKVEGTGVCPLHIARVRARVLGRGDQLELTIVVDDPSQVDELRRRVASVVSLR